MRPVWLRALRLARENGQLRRDVALLRLENARLLRRCEAVSDKLAVARRDNVILARFAHDRESARGFIDTAHEIADLPELGEAG